MMNENLKYLSLNIAGERMEFIYDTAQDRVYPRLFPGVDVEAFTSGCGMRIQPNILKQIITEKIGLLELEMQRALKDQSLKYEDLF